MQLVESYRDPREFASGYTFGSTQIHSVGHVVTPKCVQTLEIEYSRQKERIPALPERERKALLAFIPLRFHLT